MKIAGASIQAPIKRKIMTITRDLTAASGDVSTTGMGFKPDMMIITVCQNYSGLAKFSQAIWTPDVGDTNQRGWYFHPSAGFNTVALFASVVAYVDAGGSNFQTAVVKSADEDGFTLTWTKSGTPTGTANVFIIAFKF